MVFFFLIPAIPGRARQLPRPDHDRREGPGVPELNLLSWYIYMIGATFTLYAVVTGGVDTGWTFYTPFSTRLVDHATSIPAALGIFITGFSSILTGLNFIVTIHRMRAPGHDLVPAAAVRLVALRDQPDHGARHAGHRDHDPAGRGRARCSTSASSTRRSAATRCSSSTCSGSTRTRPSTSWSCRRWA